MEELLACRVCLITDVKLFDIWKYQLAEQFEILTGSEISSDYMPRHICSICAALLRKTVSFKSKCDEAQNILKCALKQHHKLTTAYVRSIDRNLHSLCLPLTTDTIQEDYFINEIEVPYKIKEEFLDDTNEDSNDIPFKNESDEEPLAEIVKRKPRKQLKKKAIKFDNNDSRDTGDLNNLTVLSDIQIVVLSKEQQIENVVSRKDSPNYLNSFYKCDKCYKGFLTSSTLKNHMVKHDPVSGPYECEVCRTRWPSKTALRTHGATSHERQYVCRKCNHVSKSSHAAKEHSKWHLGFKYTCKICGATFIKSSSHLTHIRIHHPSEHSCELCGEAFIGEYGLALHRKRAHRDQDFGRSPARCDTCGARFRSAGALERHAARPCDGLRPCLTCGEGFTTDEKLKEHSKIHLKHNVKCEKCNRTFANQKSYALHHHRAHLRPAPSVAGAGAGSGAVCETCGKKCGSKAALRYHQRSHTGERPYPCTVCPKRFAMPMFLQIHMRTHTGERPFACPRCPKAFSNRAALVRHNRVHSGVKPYPCAECDKSFTQSNSRKLHVATVHRRLPAPRTRTRSRDPTRS